uniref:Hemolymph protein n=1 Tax=Anoplophora glabripennis TaxID=217634 RepID=V5I8Q2_ANOGL
MKTKKTGSMDEVFGKYCNKWPSIYACLDNVTLTARSCMDDKEEVAFNKSLQIVSELQEFMCFKDGDRLAMFVAEGGMECVNEQKDGIQKCINETVGEKIPDPEDFSVASLPTFLFSRRDCEDFDNIRACVNKELEKCKNTTPANIVDAFFKFLKKHMPCGTTEVRGASPVQSEPSWAAKSFSASSLFTVVVLLSLKMF